MERIIQKTTWTFELIQFSHSIFALPFALSAMIVAAKGWPGWRTFTLIVIAMVSARSAAMAWNRLADADCDSQNPRTQMRHLPQGLLSKKYVIGFTLLCALLFLSVCYFMNPLAFTLAPLALIILLGYSFSKRFTILTHLWLGACLGIAPCAAWIAVTGEWPWLALSLGIAVTFWVAGFDMIYATQDFEFDSKMGVYSMVARFGIAKALWISRGFHCFSILFFILFGFQNELGPIYFSTVVLIAAGLIYEQSLVKPTDLSKVNAAFFNMNGLISFLFLVGILFHYIWEA